MSPCAVQFSLGLLGGLPNDTTQLRHNLDEWTDGISVVMSIPNVFINPVA